MRRLVTSLWVLSVLGALYTYFFHFVLFEKYLAHIVAVSPALAYGTYLALGSLRGFTLIPSSALLFVGLLFFPPLPLFFVLLAGILISSVSVYYFSEYMRLDTYLESRYHKQIATVRRLLEANEMPIIIGWSFFPLLPTDIICYVCGTLRVNVYRFILAVCIGEGIISGLYIYFGKLLLPQLHTLL